MKQPGRPKRSPTVRAPSRLNAELMAKVEAWQRSRMPGLTKGDAMEALLDLGLWVSAETYYAADPSKENAAAVAAAREAGGLSRRLAIDAPFAAKFLAACAEAERTAALDQAYDAENPPPPASIRTPE
jgi:hypothetical protein